MPQKNKANPATISSHSQRSAHEGLTSLVIPQHIHSARSSRTAPYAPRTTCFAPRTHAQAVISLIRTNVDGLEGGHGGVVAVVDVHGEGVLGDHLGHLVSHVVVLVHGDGLGERVDHLLRRVLLRVLPGVGVLAGRRVHDAVRGLGRHLHSVQASPEKPHMNT